MKKFVHGGNVYQKPPAGKKWLDFSANINPLGISEPVKKAIEAGIDDLINYPDPAGKEAKHAIAEFYDVPEEQIVLGNGAVELLYVLFHARKFPNVLLPVPSFSEYERAAEAGGVEVKYFPLQAENGFALDIDKFISNLIFFSCTVLGNPGNPTGNMLELNDIRRILDAARKTGTLVIIDESFIDFRSDRNKYSARHLVSEYDNLVILQSLTKFYALPGLRLGFVLAAPEWAAKLEQAKDPWNMNLLAQRAVCAALADEEYQRKTREVVKQESKYLTSKLTSIPGVKVFPPTVNFVLLDVRGTGLTSTELVDKMRQRGILLRNCDNYPGLDEYYVRVAVKSPADNKSLTDALEEILT